MRPLTVDISSAEHSAEWAEVPIAESEGGR